jgi:hypothetical protein
MPALKLKTYLSYIFETLLKVNQPIDHIEKAIKPTKVM